MPKVVLFTIINILQGKILPSLNFKVFFLFLFFLIALISFHFQRNATKYLTIFSHSIFSSQIIYYHYFQLQCSYYSNFLMDDHSNNKVSFFMNNNTKMINKKLEGMNGVKMLSSSR